MTGRFSVQIEVVGTCNLTCPACAVGNMARVGSIGGTMPVARFQATIDWLTREVAPAHPDIQVNLYSWGEPLIHPRIGELVAITRAAGFRCGISTNLNHAPGLEALVRAAPDEIVISLSGFRQEIYVQSHRGGDIERVKANMARLSALLRQYDTATHVFVHYHTYRHNSGRDIGDMALFSESLGFGFEPSIAYYMPVENILRVAAGDVPQADRPVLDNLLIPIETQLAVARDGAGEAEACPLIENRLDIDVDGAVKLCCASYDRRFNVAADVAVTDLAAIQAARGAASLCGDCMRAGVQRVYLRQDEPRLRALADAALAELGRDFRFAAPSDDPARQTETTQLEALLHHLVAGELEAAWRLRDALHARLAAKYRLPGAIPEAILQRLAEAPPRRGRNLPLDPARLLFAEAVLRRNLHGDAAGSLRMLENLGWLMTALENDTGYADTLRDMGPAVAHWAALPG